MGRFDFFPFYSYSFLTISLQKSNNHAEITGGGSMVGAIVGSTQREPLVVGKPSTFMMDYLAKE